MTLARRANGSTMPSFVNLFEDFFNTELGDWRRGNFAGNDATLPKVNIREDNDQFTIEVAAPGMRKSDFKVNVDNNVLVISSEKQEESKDEKNNYRRQEFSYSSFQRSFTLPEIVDSEKISARYDNGVLLLTVPKKEEAKPLPPKKIEIS